jgi:predicted LPLAT superfamily acyltransferase
VKAAVLIPHYNHAGAIPGVLEKLSDVTGGRIPCIIIDDGSDPMHRVELARAAERYPWVRVVPLPVNRGRGAALRHGYEIAWRDGFSHVVQLDADGQHDPADVPCFLAAAAARPEALVLGVPQFDDTAPWSRRYGRHITTAWVAIETLSRAVPDALCGFRVIPLREAVDALSRHRLGDHMEFDPALVVTLVWDGVPVVTVRTRVRYDVGGVSHWAWCRDNIRLSVMHARLFFGMIVRLHRRLQRPLTQTVRHAPRAAGWTTIAERGSMLGMRITISVYRYVGHRACAWFIMPIVAYFFLSDRRGRRASRRYLERLYAIPGGATALGHRPGLRDCFRHYHAFGLSVLDRVAFTLNDGERFTVTVHGAESFESLRATGRGALLIGAHLGNFDALRACARTAGLVVNVVMFTRHAARINTLLRELDPDIDLRVLHLDPSVPDTALRLRASVDRGECVAILGDRISPGTRRVVRAPFLGADASFPRGPFALAGALGCPVLFIAGLPRGDRGYEIFVEPLAEDVPSAPRLRAERLPVLVTRYAERLEALCLRAPYQWFNFYDFWGDDPALSHGDA